MCNSATHFTENPGPCSVWTGSPTKRYQTQLGHHFYFSHMCFFFLSCPCLLRTDLARCLNKWCTRKIFKKKKHHPHGSVFLILWLVFFVCLFIPYHVFYHLVSSRLPDQFIKRKPAWHGHARISWLEVLLLIGRGIQRKRIVMTILNSFSPLSIHHTLSLVMQSGSSSPAIVTLKW